LTTRIYEKMPEIIQKRLKSPPLEVFALHRLLGGVFLMCMKLRSVVPMRRIFEDIYYQVNEGGK